jgi:hypothetical protein
VEALRIKCPRCELILHEGHFSYPVCHRCELNTFRCRYCTHYDASAGQCLHTEVETTTITDPDGEPNCGFFESRLIVTEEDEAKARPKRPTLRSLSRAFWIWTALGVCVVALVATWGLRRMVASGQPTDLFGRIDQAPSDIAMGETLRVVLTVSNASHDQTGGFTVRVSDDTLRRFELTNTQPAPSATEKRGSAQYLVYEDVVPPLGSYTVVLVLAPLKPGEAHKFAIEARTSSNRPLVMWEGRIAVTP